MATAKGNRITQGISRITSQCKICRGTGYVVKRCIVPEYDPVTPVNVGDPCPVCKGIVLNGSTGIPAVYSEADMSKFRFDVYGQDIQQKQQIINSFWMHFDRWAQAGKGLYIWSNTKGSGKTFLACCLGMSIREKFRRHIKFVSSVNYLQAVKESYDNPLMKFVELDSYLNCDVLILDDLGSEKKGEWQDQELFRLIDQRLCNGKIVIVTSNVPIEDLKCDNRIIDRLSAMCISIRLPEKSIRRQKAKEEEERFIRAILN